MPPDQLTTGRTDLDNEPAWAQVNLEFTNWTSAADIVARNLRPILNQLPGGWWYIRKHPQWRIRHHPGNDTDHRTYAQLRATLDQLTRTDSLRAWNPAIYESETLAFGGPAGMHIAHDLFCRDSATTLDLLTNAIIPAPVVGRAELSLLAISRMLRAAGLDWYEQGDAWATVAASRNGPDTAMRVVAEDVPPAVRRLLTLDTGPDTALVTDGPLGIHRAWFDAFDNAGARLGTLARTGQLTRGLRAVLAHHVIFHWNRLALPSCDQLTLATLAQDALLPAELHSSFPSPQPVKDAR
jgi:protein-L-isoaspartate(D-aspartate) O-methyltransferase